MPPPRCRRKGSCFSLAATQDHPFTPVLWTFLALFIWKNAYQAVFLFYILTVLIFVAIVLFLPNQARAVFRVLCALLDISVMKPGSLLAMPAQLGVIQLHLDAARASPAPQGRTIHRQANLYAISAPQGRTIH